MDIKSLLKRKIIIPILCHFTILKQKNVQNMPRYYTACRTGQKYGLKVERQNGRTKLYFVSGIINPLFKAWFNKLIIRADILLIARIFPRPYGAQNNTAQLAKYPRVLYVRPLLLRATLKKAVLLKRRYILCRHLASFRNISNYHMLDHRIRCIYPTVLEVIG